MSHSGHEEMQSHFGEQPLQKCTLGKTIHNSMYFRKVIEGQELEIIKNMPNKTSSAFDETLPTVIKQDVLF